MLIGARTAIVPMGISCQTAFQIEKQKAAIEDLVGERLVERATPFDWRIVGLDNVAGMVERGEFYPPPAVLDMAGQAQRPAGRAEAGAELPAHKSRPRPYWRSERCWFWHERLTDFEAFTEKQAHLVENLALVRGVERRIFFVSNIQANLRTIRRDAGGFRVRIERKDVIRLADVLDRRFGPSALHMVARPNLLRDFGGLEKAQLGTTLTLEGGRVFVHLVDNPEKHDADDWRGDRATWQKVFQRALESLRLHEGVPA